MSNFKDFLIHLIETDKLKSTKKDNHLFFEKEKKNIENMLLGNIPSTYVVFLDTVGNAYTVGYSFWGAAGVDGETQLEKYTKDWRREQFIDENFVVIGSDAGVYDYFFDLRYIDKHGEYPIVEYDIHKMNVYNTGAITYIFKDYEDYFRKMHDYWVNGVDYHSQPQADLSLYKKVR